MNKPQNDVCFEEIGLHAHNLWNILGARVNIIGGGRC